MKSDVKSALSDIASLSWPAVVELALSTVVQYADTAMVGQVGAAASASVGMTGTTTWMVNAPMFAMGVGLSAFIARAYGAGDHALAKRAASQSLLLTLIIGLALTAITLLISPHLPIWFGAEPELIEPASDYFSIICAPMIFRAAMILSGAVLRAARDTKTPMRVGLEVNAINIVLNFFLIFNTREVTIFERSFTVWGAGLGVRGAALATAVSFIAGGILMLLALYKNPAVSPKGIKLKLDSQVMTACIHIGLPVAITRLCTTLGQVVFAAQVTKLGTVALAAHSLAITAEQAFYIPAMGMSTATSTLCGNALGAGDYKRLHCVATSSAICCCIIMAVSGAVLFAFPSPIMSVFTPDAEVVALGSRVLRIVALSEPIFGIAMIIEGVFNGTGRTKIPFIMSVSTMWGVRILFTWLCVNVWGLGLESVWYCMIANNIARGALLGLFYLRGNKGAKSL